MSRQRPVTYRLARRAANVSVESIKSAGCSLLGVGSRLEHSPPTRASSDMPDQPPYLNPLETLPTAITLSGSRSPYVESVILAVCEGRHYDLTQRSEQPSPCRPHLSRHRWTQKAASRRSETGCTVKSRSYRWVRGAII